MERTSPKKKNYREQKEKRRKRACVGLGKALLESLRKKIAGQRAQPLDGEKKDEIAGGNR